MKRFGFNVARRLYEQSIHPRILISPKDLPKLRRQTAAGDGKILLDALRPAAVKLVEKVMAVSDLAAYLRDEDKRPTDVRGGAFQLGFIGLLDESEPMLDAAKRLLLASAREGRIDPQGYDLLAPRLTPAERKLVTRAAIGEINKRLGEPPIRYYANAAHNLTLHFGMGGLWALLSIRGDPGVPSLQRQERELIRRYEASLRASVHPSGYPEEDIGYGTSVFGSLLLLGEALRRAGLFDPYQAYEGVPAFGQAMLHFVEPWGEAVSNTGDHGSTFNLREFSLPRVAAETGDATVLWLASTLEDAYRNFLPEDDNDHSPNAVRLRGGRFVVQATLQALLTLDDIAKPVHPSKADVPTQFCDRGRGIITFRSGWNADATYVTLDGSHRSPAGPGHGHDSAGHFSLSALGETFAIDTGRYNMEQDQHNVVIVDGKSGRSTDGQWVGSRRHGHLIAYEPADFCDVAATDSSHQSDCAWARRWLGLVKGGGLGYVWTVEDVNKNDDFHEFWWQVQTSPRNTIDLSPRGATITGWRYGNMLDVSILLPTPLEYRKPHTLKWAQDVNSTSSFKYVPNASERAAAYVRPERMAHGPCFVRPRLLAKVTGGNGRFMSVMTPRKKGSPAARVRRLDCLPSSLAAQVDFGPYRDTIVFAYEHDVLEAGDVNARGHWAVVRRQRSSGKVVAWTLGHGRSLEVGGKRLV